MHPSDEPHEHELPYYLDLSEQPAWSAERHKKPLKFRRDKIFSPHKKFRLRSPAAKQFFRDDSQTA